MHAIGNGQNFDNTTCSKAQSLLECWPKFETILLAFIYLKLFQHLTPASNYLQTKGLDFTQAFHIINNTTVCIKAFINDFDSIMQKATNFLSQIDQCELLSNTNVVIETELPEIRTRKRKLMPGEIF